MRGYNPFFHIRLTEIFDFSPEIPESSPDTKQTVPDDYNDKEIEDPLEEIGNSIFGWVKDTVGNKGSSLLNKVAEKAKNSMGSVITTLDPQMKDFICKILHIFVFCLNSEQVQNFLLKFVLANAPGYELIVTSEKEVEVSSIREAFQSAFKRITVR